MVGVEGMGWAISGKVAMSIIEELVQNGYVIRPWLGVAVSSVNQYLKYKYNLATDKGALISEIVADSPADEAGLEIRDVIVSFEDREITTAEELIQAIHYYQIGQRIKIIYWRGDTKYITFAVLTESPPP
jgi:serine protease Do